MNGGVGSSKIISNEKGDTEWPTSHTAWPTVSKSPKTGCKMNPYEAIGSQLAS